MKKMLSAHALAVIIFSLQTTICTAQVPLLINYQGKLISGTNLYNGTITMGFRLFDAATGGTLLYIDTGTVTVVDGLYSTYIGDGTDYGDLKTALQTSPLYLEVLVGSTLLSPRERISSVAYAQIAGGVTNEAISTAMLAIGAVTSTNLAINSVTSLKIVNGAVNHADLANDAVEGDKIADGTITADDVSDNVFWSMSGNVGTTAGTHFLGTTDNQPLEIKVNNTRALRVEYNSSSPSLVGGHRANTNSAYGAVIAGGGSSTSPNRITDGYGVVGGGLGNMAGDDAGTTLDAAYATVGGGMLNFASGKYSTVPGGWDNTAAGESSFAAGVGARAMHPSTFVWADSQASYFTSTGTNQFLVRAEGGVGLQTATPRQQLSVGNNLDLYSGSANDPQQASVRASVLGHLFLNARSNSDVYINYDAGDNLLINLNGGKVGIGNITLGDMLNVGGGIIATGVVIAESFVGDGSGLTSLNGSNIAASTISGSQLKNWTITANNVISNVFWNTTGNAGTTAGTHFVGTTDDQPLDVRVNNGRALRITPNVESPILVGGYSSNTASNQADGAVIAGGGSIIAPNRVTDSYGVIGGGRANRAGDADIDMDDAAYGVIGGGYGNIVTGKHNVISGGDDNRGGGNYSSVPGGQENWAYGDYSLAAGRRAHAVHPGAFVWADSLDANFTSTRDDQFLIRAAGGVGINTNNPAVALHVSGDIRATGVISGESLMGDGSGLNDLDGANIQVGTVGNSQLGANAVATDKIAADAVGNSDLHDDAVTSDKILDGTITTSDVYSNAFWRLDGNRGVGAAFLGTTDNNALDIKIYGYRALRLEPSISSPNVICGFNLNTAGFGVSGAAISGGGGTNQVNEVLDSFGAIGGGLWNTAGSLTGSSEDAKYATVAGGTRNTASDVCTTIGGGSNNAASEVGATIGGGVGNSASGSRATVGGGDGNASAGDYAVIGGGADNRADGNYSAVGGGEVNTASGDWSAIGGGANNKATGSDAFVGGGQGNEVAGTNAVVAGGYKNKAPSYKSTVVGGDRNVAKGMMSFVGGGYTNVAYGDYSAVGGGFMNLAADDGAVVSGGRTNDALATYATVGGGDGNQAQQQWSTIAGGLANVADADESTIGGGKENHTSGQFSTISGGRDNSAEGASSTIGGGKENLAQTVSATVGGGDNNEATDEGATVAGGRTNEASGVESAVGGGNKNKARGLCSTVPGGLDNTAAGDYSFAAGYNAKTTNNSTFVWSDRGASDFASNATNQFLIRARGGIGINTADTGWRTITVEDHDWLYAMLQLESLDKLNTLCDQLLLIAPSNTAFEGGNFIEARWSDGNIKFYVDSQGEVHADGTFHGSGADFAEQIELSTGPGSAEAGDVMEIDPARSRSIVKSSAARSTRIAGIYSTKPGFVGQERDSDLTPPADIHEIPLAIVGIVPCKVSAEGGTIRPGDLLVSASLPGHAMRDDHPEVGTVIGKALEPLDSGTGLIKVLVTVK